MCEDGLTIIIGLQKRNDAFAILGGPADHHDGYALS